jgi:hypothetical protein
MKPEYFIDMYGSEHWTVDNKHHRTDGPAIVWFDGNVLYWLDGKQIFVEDWYRKVLFNSVKIKLI